MIEAASIGRILTLVCRFESWTLALCKKPIATSGGGANLTTSTRFLLPRPHLLPWSSSSTSLKNCGCFVWPHVAVLPLGCQMAFELVSGLWLGISQKVNFPKIGGWSRMWLWGVGYRGCSTTKATLYPTRHPHCTCCSYLVYLGTLDPHTLLDQQKLCLLSSRRVSFHLSVLCHQWGAKCFQSLSSVSFLLPRLQWQCTAHLVALLWNGCLSTNSCQFGQDQHQRAAASTDAGIWDSRSCKSRTFWNISFLSTPWLACRSIYLN